ncbi:armadillo-type protein [Chytridium lagenaria]|nr:armadillo-type protein [Chytridium lagenaria]
MADAKYFQRGKIQELRTELNSDKKDSKHVKKKIVLKKIVANMTMGNDMSALFNDVSKPDMARLAVNAFMKDLNDTNPIIRALALRTMGYIQVDKITECLCDQLRGCLSDKDPYVCKTAAIAVSKLFFLDKSLVQNMGFLDYLRSLVDHENATVQKPCCANAVVTLCEISDRSQDIELSFEFTMGQVYILESLLQVIPQDHNDAELLADRVIPRLQHANSAVLDDVVDGLYRKLGPPLVTLLHNAPEIQYIALRNIILLLQKKPDFLKSEIRVFFCKYNDAIYVKLAKLEVICRLVTDETVDQVLSELKEYATEVDVDFVRKSVRSIGRFLFLLIRTKVNYVIQEAIVVMKYPNRYESVIGILCEDLEELEEVEAKASLIWIIGQYSERLDNANELLEQFMETFREDAAEVQLALLTAVVKLFIKQPSAGQDLVPRILKWATEEVDNPDLRDRGFIYWRLLSTNAHAAKTVVLAEKPDLSFEAENFDNPMLDELLLHISTLSSIYHRPPNTFIGGYV